MRLSAALASLLFVAGCGGGSGDSDRLASTAQSCMTCHNGSPHDDYAGPGLENPHPYAPADNLECTDCHGGNPEGHDALSSHVPPPPEIGDETFQTNNTPAYFNRRTLTGIDKFADYTVGGVDYTALDYLQFINPGDLRVVTQGRSCGQCHAGHADCVADSLLATSAGIFSGATFAAGAENQVPQNQGLWEDTAADIAFRPASDVHYVPGAAEMGTVGSLDEFPVFSARGDTSPDAIQNNDAYLNANIGNQRLADNRVQSNSELANLYHEQVAFTCGDCHLGSAGANNRYGDFRSSGCTSCHMQYSRDGRARGTDPNAPTLEPLDPDQIRAPERAHVERHLVRSVAKTLPSGQFVPGISDYACAGCHQGSNRTVMQYWGIRLDQNEDVRRGKQYPANPASYTDTRNDTRLFDPVVDNDTFNGRRDRQYLLHEDYDGDGRDDTPADVHYEAGLGCIDCHGSYDLHGGNPADPTSSPLRSRMEQAVAIRCESCHGSVGAYASTVAGTNSRGEPAMLAVDAVGNPLDHVQLEADGHVYLYSRLTGQRHYVSQTRDVVVDNGRTNTLTGEAIFSQLASYAMGRDDGNPATGIGPRQTGSVPAGFSHSDDMSCASCHSSWTNNCIGCHLVGEYDNGNNFSNITGQRIVYKEKNADFVYQSPVPFHLGVGSNGKIEPISPNTEVFYRWEDRNNVLSDVFSFSDRNGKGNNPAQATFPSLSHNVMMPHSIRGKVSATDEGPRYCVSCHLTDSGLATYQADYDTLRTAMSTGNYSTLTPAFFDKLKVQIGQNTGNQLNSPLWVHSVAGLGTGLFLFDDDGCPVNPLDTDANRKGCDGQAPATTFDLGRVALNLDRLVNEAGQSTGSNNHPMQDGLPSPLRNGAADPTLSGPLGQDLLRRLTDPATGIVLDSWIDADGALGGDAGTILNP